MCPRPLVKTLSVGFKSFLPVLSHYLSYIRGQGSQTCRHVHVSWKTCRNSGPWIPPPEFLIRLVWDGAQGPAFLAMPQVMLLLQDQEPLRTSVLGQCFTRRWQRGLAPFSAPASGWVHGCRRTSPAKAFSLVGSGSTCY